MSWETTAGAGLGLALDMITDDWRKKQQYKQQEKLQKLQIEGQKEMVDYNNAASKNLTMDIWNATNAEAQREHMENAGLNVGLMYKGSGAGGATASPQTGNVSGTGAEEGKIGMGVQTGMQMAQTAANIKLTEAQAKLAEDIILVAH